MKRHIMKNLCAGLILLGNIFAGGSLSILTAEDAKDYDFDLIPTIKSEMLQLGEENYLLSPSGSLQLMWTKSEESDSKAPDKITGKVSYSEDIFTKGIEGYDEKLFHGLGLFGKVVCGKNSFLLKVDGRGANPFGSYKNFEGLLMYGRQLVKTDSINLTLGGGLAATDTGINIKGVNLFVVPMPMVYFNYSGEILEAEFEFIGLPSLRFTLLPQNMFRLIGNCSLAGFDLPTDLRFDCAISCFPLKEGPMKDYLSISAGISNNVNKFRIDTDNSLKHQYYCAYGEINATAISIRAGYAFSGKEILSANGEKTKRDYEGGFYASIQGMYKF
ncbi:MAG: hypothetical protein J6S91_03865 [Treponema sp.]|nr:hypothetical protein [Treponema sp.]